MQPWFFWINANYYFNLKSFAYTLKKIWIPLTVVVWKKNSVVSFSSSHISLRRVNFKNYIHMELKYILAHLWKQTTSLAVLRSRSKAKKIGSKDLWCEFLIKSMVYTDRYSQDISKVNISLKKQIRELLIKFFSIRHANRYRWMVKIVLWPSFSLEAL